MGFQVCVARGDSIIVDKAYGPADAELNVPADPQSLFRIGSVTKQFTAAAILKLVENGTLSLDDDITTYLPGYPTQGHTVTIRHLLTHTSGIRSYTGIPGFMEKHTAYPLAHDELLAYFKDEPFDFAPGEAFAYNNSGYYLLGMIIEHVSGQSYGDYLQGTFFTQLGLAHTRYDSTDEIIPGRAQGYTIRDRQLSNDKPVAMEIPGAAGGLLSTAGDLVRWQQALIEGKAVSPESYQLMISPFTLNDGKPTRYGFGLAFGVNEGHRVIDHGGGIFGFTSFLALYPDDDLHIAVIANNDSISSERLAREIAFAALGIQRPEVKDLALSDEERRPFIGTFKFNDIPLEARFFEQDGQMMVQATDQPAFRLLYQGDREYRASFDTGVRFVFAEDYSSFVLHQGGAELLAERINTSENSASQQ